MTSPSARLASRQSAAGLELDRPHFLAPADRKTKRKLKTSFALRFMHQVLGLEHLHYGLWTDQDPLDRGGLEAAQRRYAEHLLELIPERVHRVLDVGCGTGATARLLLERGYEVHGLSPDPYHRRLFDEDVKAPFYLGRFQEFVPDWSYDLVLMSESCQYIWLDQLFESVARVAPGGWWLVADYFVVESGRGELAKSGHPLDEFRRLASREGFELEHEEDVTQASARTMELARHWLDRYVKSSIDLVGATARDRHPLLSRAGGRLLRGQLRRLDRLEELTDAAEFERIKRYLILRFRIPEPIEAASERRSAP